MLVVIWCCDQTGTDRETSFSRQTSCRLQERLISGCAQLLDKPFKSVTECAVECAKDSFCTGINLDGSSCYLHQQCPQEFTCGTDSLFILYVKVSTNDPCQHNGVWNTTTNRCLCSGGWVGTVCERLAKTCKELAENGYPQGWSEGLIWVSLNTDTYSSPFQVLCELRFDYFNTYIMRNDGWGRQAGNVMDDYLNGYTKTNSNFWLGLTKMKALNDAGHTVLKLDTGYTLSDYNLFQFTYNDFKMESAAVGFTFTFGTTDMKKSGSDSDNKTYGDCLTPLKGAKFSAPNNDLDADSDENCAEEAGVGWWFKDCNGPCNPLGYKVVDSSTPYKETMFMKGLNCENIPTCAISMYFVSY